MTVPTVLAEINFDAAVDVTGSFTLNHATLGLLDTGTLAEADTWVDVTEWLIDFTSSRGVNDGNAPILRYEGGTGTANLRNEDRRFDPANLGGPYVSGGATLVEPLRMFRLRAEWADVLYDVFVGYIDWRFGYQGPTQSVAELDLTDGFEIINMWRLGETEVGGGELSGARIHRILDSAQWPAELRQIADGNTTLQATTLEGDALSELMLVTDTEIGELYVDEAGRVVFRNRHAMMLEERSAVSQATFGSDRGAGELPYVSVGIEYKRPVANIVHIGREGGTVQTAEVPARYPATFERTDLVMDSDAVAADYAHWILGMSKDPEFKFSTLTVDPRAQPFDLYPQVLGRRVGDRITIIRRPPGGGDPVERDVIIRGIDHAYSSGRWITNWTLQSATKYAFFVLDDPTLGVLNTNQLAY